MLLESLKQHFGYEKFREGQQEAITSIMEGKDVMVVFPTSAGKSLTFQLPALLKQGVCIVVSPLISLMKDQVDGLNARNIPAVFINSTLGWSEVLTRLKAMRRGEYKFVYIAPERFRSDEFVRALMGSQISMFVVDEFHNISTADFRPDYRKLKAAIDICGRPQVVALTATATKEYRKDCIAQLGMKEPKIFITGFDRQNLRIGVQTCTSEMDKISELERFLRRQKDNCGIIYVASRKVCESLTDVLRNKKGFDVLPYHAGMKDDQRVMVQDSFMGGETPLIVATNAFGMGIDKANIRFVVHYQMPKSVEAYYQEIGRAGRDGLSADCLTLYYSKDERTQRFFIESSNPTPLFIQNCWKALIELHRDNLIIQDEAYKHVLTDGYLCRRMGEDEYKTMSVSSCVSFFERVGNAQRITTEDGYQVAQVITNKDVCDVDTEVIYNRRLEEEKKFYNFLALLKSNACLRKEIVKYFGDTTLYERCGSCSSCRKHKDMTDELFSRATLDSRIF